LEKQIVAYIHTNTVVVSDNCLVSQDEGHEKQSQTFDRKATWKSLYGRLKRSLEVYIKVDLGEIVY
jgi:hypothetical protein